MEEVSLRRSRLELCWTDLLTGEQIVQGVSSGGKTEIPKRPGVYRWLFASNDSGISRAYVGQSGNLRTRISEYLDEAWKQVRESSSSKDHIDSAQQPKPEVTHSAARYIDPTDAKDALENRTEVKVEGRNVTDYYQVLERCLKANRRWATIRVGAQLAWKHDKSGVQLQVLQAGEEEWFHGVEVSAQLLNDRVGRVFLEHWAILYTERKGYKMLNRNRSKQGEDLRQSLEESHKKSVVEGARL